MVTATEWLARVRHDLVKRLVWPARDRRDLGGPVGPGELVAALIDDEGAPIGAIALWERLRQDAPAPDKTDLLDGFEAAVQAAMHAAAADDLDGVLALEAAFEQLARNMKGPHR
jgi:hypothetical protein